MTTNPNEESSMICTIGRRQVLAARMIALLPKYRVALLADVPSVPYSRPYLQFNRQTIQQSYLKETA